MHVNIISIAFANSMLTTHEALIDQWAQDWSDMAEVNNEMKYGVDPEDTEEIESYKQTLSEGEIQINILDAEIDRLTEFMTTQGILTGVDANWANK